VGTDGVRTSRAGILRDEARACRGVSTSTSKVKLVIEFQRNVVACCIRCQDLTTMKVGAKKLQIKTNTARKKDLNVKGRIIFDALMQRTQLKAVDATSLKGGKESIVKLFSNLGEVGIEEGDVSFFQVTANIRLQGVCARGGLSVIEGKSLNKTIVSYKWTLKQIQERRVFRFWIRKNPQEEYSSVLAWKGKVPWSIWTVKVSQKTCHLLRKRLFLILI
jgi:hypothetical protein